MKFQQENTIRGMKRSKGNMDGVAFDSTTLFIDVDLDDSKGNGVGISTNAHKFGLSDEYMKFAHLTFPFQATCTWEVVTNGKDSKLVLTDVIPVVAKPSKAA